MLRTLVAGGFIATVATLSAAGCSTDNSTLFITGVLYTKAPACVVTADPGGVYLGSGVLDVAFATNYKAWVLVGNQYTPRGSKDNLRTETTGVNLRGAEISLTTSEGNPIACGKTPGCDKFSVFGSGFAHSAKGTDPGWGLFAADLIPDSVGEGLKASIGQNRSKTMSIVANIKVFGDTLGNQEITSGQLSFPINVCYGCLIQYPLASVVPDPANKGKFICQVGASSAPTLGCNPGQDDAIDCTSCTATKTACLNVPSTN
jgi:hypothetical protein